MPMPTRVKTRPAKPRGFTLIELLVVLLLMAVGIAVTLGYNYGQRDSATLRSAARQTSAFLNAANDRAILAGLDNRVLYDPAGGSLTDQLKGAVLNLPEDVAVPRPDFVGENEAFEIARFYADGSADAARVRLTLKERELVVAVDPILGEASVLHPDEADTP